MSDVELVAIEKLRQVVAAWPNEEVADTSCSQSASNTTVRLADILAAYDALRAERDATALTRQRAGYLLGVREALVNGNNEEAFHALRLFADTYSDDIYDHWKGLEAIYNDTDYTTRLERENADLKDKVVRLAQYESQYRLMLAQYNDTERLRHEAMLKLQQAEAEVERLKNENDILDRKNIILVAEKEGDMATRLEMQVKLQQAEARVTALEEALEDIASKAYGQADKVACIAVLDYIRQRAQQVLAPREVGT